jgi:hypothetical protein
VIARSRTASQRLYGLATGAPHGVFAPRELAQLTLIDPRVLLQNKRGLLRLAPLFMNSIFSRFRLQPERAFAACAKRAYTHYSNFEWLSIVSAFAGLEGVVIAQQFKNPLLDPIFLKLRQRSGHRVAPREGAVMQTKRGARLIAANLRFRQLF